ncbi:MAG: AarF/ABC1/UbiB kinase family protein [Polyangiales bacterium]
MANERELPTGQLARLGSVARVGARTGLAMLARGDGSGAAEHAAELLGNLRGIAAKVGQMASYVDGFLPEGQGDAYARALASLQSDTPSSPFPSIREVIERELGSSLESLFAEFDVMPLASASIGQVHRARLTDGTAVAVKVQHPGIEAAIETDLRSAAGIAALVGAMAPKKVEAKALYDEVASRFREELDYRLEAERQTAFAALHAEDPRIHIPRVFASHSARRVLTTELATGITLDEAAADQDEARRRAYVELLWTFVFRGILRQGVFNADPHPGNYLFHPDGRITFLDFGCVETMGADYLEAVHAMHRAALAGDRERHRAAAKRGLGTDSGAYEDALLGHLWRCFEPIRSTPFRMERNYVSDLVRGIQELKVHMIRRGSNVTPVPRGVVFLNRLQFGFYSILARFDVDADYRGVDRELVERL